MASFKANAATGTISSMTSLIVQLAITPYALKQLGPNLYGVWSAVSIVSIFGTIGNQGLADSLTRFVAHLKKDKQTTNKDFDYLSATLLIGAGFSALTFVTIYLLSETAVNILQISPEYREQSILLAQYMSILPTAIVFDNITSAYVAGKERYDLVNYTKVIASLARGCTTITLLHIGFSHWSLYIGLLMMHICILLILTIIIFSLFSKDKKLTLKGARDCFPEIIAFTKDIISARLLNLSIDPLIRVLITRSIGLPEVGYYNISMRFVFAFQSIFRSAIKAYLPLAAKRLITDTSALKSLRSRTNRLSSITFFLMIASLLTFYIFGQSILEIWLGKAYDPIVFKSFYILFSGYIINTSVYPFVVSYLALGKSKYLVHNYYSLVFTLWTVLALLWAANFINYINILWAHTIALIATSIHAYLLYKKSIQTSFTNRHTETP